MDMDHAFRDGVSSLAGNGGSKPIEAEHRRAGTTTLPETDSRPRKGESVNKQNEILNNDKKSTSETAASASLPASMVPVCKRYRRGICPH